MSSEKIPVHLKRLCAGALAAALLVVPVLADTIGGAKVATDGAGLNLRPDASTNLAPLALIPDGAFLLVEEELDGWYKVAYNGRSGYVSADYALFSETLDGAYEFSAATTGTYVNLRAGAGTGYGVLKNLWALGTALNITGVSGNWLKVRDAAGTEGYVRSDLLSYSAPAPAAETKADVGAAVGEQLVETAKQYLGYRYVWGGMSPSTGFDCSGFANYIYSLYGYSMSRVAQYIYYNDGVSVSVEELRPGDLLFFGDGPSSVGHVGIYAGNDQMIHASSYDTGVIISDLQGHYYNDMVGAKRLIT